MRVNLRILRSPTQHRSARVFLWLLNWSLLGEHRGEVAEHVHRQRAAVIYEAEARLEVSTVPCFVKPLPVQGPPVLNLL